MRRTFFIQAGETQKDYFTRAAKLQAAIKNGEAIDGVAVTEQEAKEFIDYVFEKMYSIVNRVVECEARVAKLNAQVAEIFRLNYTIW